MSDRLLFTLFFLFVAGVGTACLMGAISELRKAKQQRRVFDVLVWVFETLLFGVCSVGFLWFAWISWVSFGGKP